MKTIRFPRPLIRLSLVAALATVSALNLHAATPITVAKPDGRLAEAVQQNDRAAVVSLLQQHVPVDSALGDGTTALHWAAYNDNLPLAKLLLEAHANVHATTRLEAFTPLLMACTNGSAPMIDLLLAHGASANDANALGTTPLMLAAASGNVAAVTTLLAHGADPNAKESTHDQTALIFAANLDRADVIKVLLAHHADPNLQTKVVSVARVRPAAAMPTDGAAAAPADTATGKRRNQKADDAAPATPTDLTAAAPATQPIGSGVPKELQPSAAKSPSDASKEPIPPTPAAAPSAGAKAGVDAAPTPTGGRRRGPAVETAATAPTEADIKKAAAAAVAAAGGGGRGASSIGGLTPLLMAARQGSTEAVKALVEGGAKVDEASGSEQTTPLVLAIANGHFDTAKALIEGGANPNLANVMGVTPLYATIDVQWAPHEWSPEPVVAQEKTSYLALMQLLLDKGADPNARLGRKIWSRALSQDATWTDPSGATAFWRAAQADDLPAMKLLVANHADPKIPSKNGVTPLMMAAGLGWGMNYSVAAPGNRIATLEYCISLGLDVDAVDASGYTALHGAAFIGDNSVIKFLTSKGAKTDRKTKEGDSAADMANGPFAHSIPYPETVSLLEQLGSPNDHNCRSDQCVVAPKDDKAGATGRGGKGAAAAVEATPAPAAEPAKPAATLILTAPTGAAAPPK